MALELKVPEMGESITEVQIGEWLKGEGEAVNADDAVVVIESEKATVDLPAPAAGTVTKVLKRKGETARVGEVIGYLEESSAAKSPEPRAAVKEKPVTSNAPSRLAEPATPTPDPAPVAAAVAASPPARIAEPGREEEIIPLSPIRRLIAARLVEAQHTAALLTTFNEIDMSAVMSLRKEHQATFQERHGVKLGIMSFFVKATIEALKLVPQLNAELRGNDVAYRNYHDIGIAVGGGKGLVVPVLKDSDRKSFAEIEKAIADFATRATEGKLMPSELRGGTFTISNGGVYGSLLSTPIVNPPQSGVLGMHAIQERPVARDGQVVIRPMMYVALTYDHRLVDGREAVTFLKRVRECVEAPWRILIDI